MHLSSHYTQIPLDTQEIPQSLLNIEKKKRSNPLKWNGQFSPQLVEILLRVYATQTTRVFDPFLGSGTILLEAGRQGLAASGTEVNPAAYTLSSVYQFIPLPAVRRKRHLQAVSDFLNHQFRLTIFKAHQPTYDETALKKHLVSGLELCENDYEVGLLKNLIILLDFKQQQITVDDIFRAWRKLAKLVTHLPASQNPIHVYHADARQTPLAPNSIDMILTSPPYINVFNYHQQYRASVELLNYEVLQIAKSEIGANRKHRSNRFLTVTQYCLDMAWVFKELLRITTPQSRIIFVVGRESSIRGTPFFNGQIVTEIAHRIFHLSLHTRQERCFLNRFGQTIYEDILHFAKPTFPNDNLAIAETARMIAQDVLTLALAYAADDAQPDIKQALDSLENVTASPIFTLPTTG